ncbi:family 1 glycosylhydrolase [Paractinoplanes deccanensis]|nr:family 1 glycosylhydrolase [Actinoplanes deccanensis]
MVGEEQERLWQRVAELNREQRDELAATLERLSTAQGQGLIAAAAGFRDDLVTGEGPRLDARGGEAVLSLVRLHPGARGGRTVAVGLTVLDDAGVGAEGAEIVVHGGLGLLVAADPGERDLEALTLVAVGADGFSVLVRELLLGRRLPGLDRLERRPPKLADLTAAPMRGCLAGVRRALGALGRAASYAKQVAAVEQVRRTWATGIGGLVPAAGCAGGTVEIRGSGFGATRPANTNVLFPSAGGGCVNAEVVGWSDTVVTVRAPGDAGVGCVGFTWAPDPPDRPAGAGDLTEAVGGLAGEIEACLGFAAAAAVQRLRDRGVLAFLGPRPACPECLPGDVNRFRGGRPVIRSFTADRARLVSDDAVELRWRVENADTVEIRPVRVGPNTNELPALPSGIVLDPVSGTHRVPSVPGTRPWRGAYELRAVNSCAPAADAETARVEVEMSVRRPTGFLWGTATAGYQVEGGITGNDWHFFTSTPEIVHRVHELGAFRDFDLNLVPAGEAVQHGSAFVAMSDVLRSRLAGANAYRFSVEWSRVERVPGEVDRAALDYYVSLVELLIRQGVEPVVTLNHLALPLWASKAPVKSKGSLPGFPAVADDSDAGHQASLRGWENGVTVDRWIAFVRLVVGRLSRAGVRFWITLNEPVGSVVGVGYIAGVWPPGFSLEGGKAQAAYKNLLRAHVRAYRAIKEIDPAARVGLAHQMAYYKPSSAPNPLGDNVAAANQEDYFYNWHFLDAATSGTVDVKFARRPADRVYESSDVFFQIPAADWMPTLDFVGVNYYRAIYAYHDAVVSNKAGFIGGGFVDAESTSLTTGVGWEVYPDGLLAILTRIRDDYQLPVLITENGLSEPGDTHRAPYLVAHLDQLRRAMDDGVDVLGYLVWTVVDNYEWQYGFEPKAHFGLWTVDRGRRDAYGAHARAMTAGALAFRQVADATGGLAGRVASAVDRFGAYSGAGDRIDPPAKSPGALWEGTMGGLPFALYLMRTASGLAGMVFDGGARRWGRAESLTWHAATGRLAFFVPLDYGGVERGYVATLTGDQFTGTAEEWTTTRPWQAGRVWLDGTWTATGLWQALSFTAVSRWEAPLPAGAAERWVGKGLAAQQSSEWTRFAAVRFTAPTVSLWLVDEAATGTPDFTASLSGSQSMQGSDPTGSFTWTASRAPDDVLGP